MGATLHEPKTESSILTRLFDLRGADLVPESAAFLLSIEFDVADVERMDHLSNLAQSGSLTPDEEAELDAYLEVGGFLTILHARARKAPSGLTRNRSKSITSSQSSMGACRAPTTSRWRAFTATASRGPISPASIPQLERSFPYSIRAGMIGQRTSLGTACT